MRRNLFMAAAMVIAAITARPADAGTIVRFTTNLGTFDVQLFDEQVPTTVANFLGYVGNGSYVNSLFHRSTTYNSADIQIVQGGGFVLNTNVVSPIATADPIQRPSPPRSPWAWHVFLCTLFAVFGPGILAAITSMTTRAPPCPEVE